MLKLREGGERKTVLSYAFVCGQIHKLRKVEIECNTGKVISFLLFTLRTIKLIDDRLANPAYGLQRITGLAMAFLLPLPLTTPWLLTALILHEILMLVGLGGYTPTLRRQIQLLDREGLQSPNYQALARRGTFLGVVLAILAIAIVFLIVVKPGLWA